MFSLELMITSFKKKKDEKTCSLLCVTVYNSSSNSGRTESLLSRYSAYWFHFCLGGILPGTLGPSAQFGPIVLDVGLVAPMSGLHHHPEASFLLSSISSLFPSPTLGLDCFFILVEQLLQELLEKGHVVASL